MLKFVIDTTLCRKIQGVIVLVILNQPRARPILKLPTRSLPELYS